VEAHPELVTVYNFEVENTHTYFVEDGQGEQTAIWVHNKCAGLHHLFPFAWGSTIPRGSKLLTYLNKENHTLIHKEFSDFLERATEKVLGKGNGLRFNSISGEQWVKKFGRAQLVEWAGQFHAEFGATTAGIEMAKNQ
jgi:hypothetical protein